MAPEIALTWQLGTDFGWGLFGLHIALQLKLQGRAEPILLSRSFPYDGDPIEWDALERIWRHNRPAIDKVQNSRPAGTDIRLHVPVINALGNDAARQFVHPAFNYRGSLNHGLVFLENALITDEGFARFDGYDTLTAGSTWARDVLRERGIARTETCIQGIDPWLFHPAPRRGYLTDRFVIFSGGKLEFRKGQDIVIEAVKRFRERHPETLLLSVWDNPWRAGRFVKLLDRSPHYPEMLDHIHDSGIDWPALLGSVGLSDGAIRVFKIIKNSALPSVMREADVALFANRCEGGTNMMAMQSMACGVPTILSANTGHLDIISDGACLALTSQRPVTLDHPEISTDGWGESDIDEILDALEKIYQDRVAARRIGAAGATLMHRHTWQARIADLADLLGL